MKVRAGLLAMAEKGDEVALLAFVSGGLYAGRWRASAYEMYVEVVDEVGSSM